MSNVLQQISVDILHGVDQKDPRWSEWGEVYSDKPGIFAFWDTVTNTQPSRNDLRQFVQDPTSGTTEGAERPGQLPGPQVEAFSTVAPKKSMFLDFEPDRVATLRIIKRPQGASTRVVTGRRVIGTRKESFDQVVEITEPILSLTGVKTLLQTNSFLLQNGNEQFAEKFQISETFGDPVIFLFGKRQQIFQYGGILFDTGSWQWKEKFLDNYERFLRGTKAIENGAICILTTNTAIIRGYILQCSIMQSEQTHGFVGFNFAMFVQDRIPLRPIEQTPEDRQAAMESDPQIVLIRLNDKTGDPNAVLKSFLHAEGSVALTGDMTHPEGFSAQDFMGRTVLRVTPPIPQPGGNIPAQVNFPATGLIDPPQLLPTQDMPAPYLNTMVLASIGNLQNIGQGAATDVPNSTVPGFNNLPECSLSITPSVTGQDTSATLLQTSGLQDDDCSNHTGQQVNNIFAGGITGRLSVVLHYEFSNLSVFRDVTAVRIWNVDGTAPPEYRSTNNDGTPIGRVPKKQAFEMDLSSAITPAHFGLARNFLDSDRFRVEFFLDDTFVADNLVVPPVGPPGPMVYHVQGARKLMRVAASDGTSLNTFPNQKHVLTDANATFQTDLQAFIDDGDEIFVTLAYPVVDEQAPTFNPSAKVKVYSIIDQTHLQLGLLTLSVANGLPGIRERIAKMDLPTYQVLVQRGTSIHLIEGAIRKRIQDPPAGAFSSINLSTADLVQPKGVFELKEGVHFTK